MTTKEQILQEIEKLSPHDAYIRGRCDMWDAINSNDRKEMLAEIEQILRDLEKVKLMTGNTLEECDDCISRLAVLEVIRKCHCEEWVKADIGAPIEALQSVTPTEKVMHWIPVSERLPKDGKRVMWCFTDGAIGIERYKCDAIDHFYPQQGQHGLEEAVAWMPLPKPYKASPTGAESEAQDADSD